MNFEDRKNKLIHHEVGHWIAAKFLGFEVGSITLKIHESNGVIRGHHGTSKIYLEPSFNSIDDIEKYLIKRMAVLAAGVSAQKGVDNKTIAEIWKIDASHDYSKFLELSNIVRGIRFKDSINRENEITQIESINEEACELVLATISEGSIANKVFDNVVEYVSKRLNEPNIEIEISIEELNQFY